MRSSLNRFSHRSCQNLVIVGIITFAVLQAPSRAQDTINYELWSTPQYVPPAIYLQPVPESYLEPGRVYGVQPSGELYLTATAVGRASVVGDDTRLATFAKGNFLPSAIPAAGQPFFGTGSRANVLGSGSAVQIHAYTPPGSDIAASAHSQFLVDNLGFGTAGDSFSGNISVRQAFGQINRLSAGLMETAFADPAAVPETLDLAGPNARITVNDAGLGAGQGRISYDFFDDPKQGGFTVTTSLEQPLPEIAVTPTTGVFARYPDLVVVAQYVAGDISNDTIVERWHLQYGAVVRSLGLENSSDTLREDVSGWGLNLSGAYRFEPRRCLNVHDRVAFSVTYGEGIAHYVTDLNNMTDPSDAVLNGAGSLVALPVLGWCAGYTHNWGDYLRSTATYSYVNVDGIAGAGGAPTSPYRSGDYLAVNLVYHDEFRGLPIVADNPTKYKFYTGLEYLFGRKEALDGNAGEAQRVMWTTALVK